MLDFVLVSYVCRHSGGLQVHVAMRYATPFGGCFAQRLDAFRKVLTLARFRVRAVFSNNERAWSSASQQPIRPRWLLWTGEPLLKLVCPSLPSHPVKYPRNLRYHTVDWCSPGPHRPLDERNIASEHELPLSEVTNQIETDSRSSILREPFYHVSVCIPAMKNFVQVLVRETHSR